MASEKNFENRVKAWLKGRERVWFVKFFANRNTKAGVPDILACVGGTFLGLELKGVGGKPSALQLVHLDLINRAGGVGVIAWPEDFEALKALIEALERGERKDDIIFKGIYLHEMP